MKLIKLSALLVLALAVTFGTTGCKKRTIKTTDIPGHRPGRVGGEDLSTANTGPVRIDDRGVETFGGTPQPSGDPSNMNQDRNYFAAQTVHFAFDSAAVRSGEQSKVVAVADALKSNPILHVIIEGHCDERGTEGYNQALGSNRANTLREELVRLGVNPERVFTKSLGEMQPAVDGHDESAWGQNRRGQFIAATPK